MDQFSVALCSLFLLLAGLLFSEKKTRTWTRASDSCSLETGFVSADLEKNHVELLLKNGKTYAMRLSELSESDQDWIEHSITQARTLSSSSGLRPLKELS